MPIPEIDLARAQVRVEADVKPRSVTIVEVRPSWDAQGEEMRFPIARLRYTANSGLWSLYWPDRNLRFHAYGLAQPTTTVQNLLDHVDRDETAIFWG